MPRTAGAAELKNSAVPGDGHLRTIQGGERDLDKGWKKQEEKTHRT